MADVVKAKCRQCGKESPAESFVLDHNYKMMVCPACSEKRAKENNAAITARKKAPTPDTVVNQKVEEKKCAWDAEDEYLSRLYQLKDQDLIHVKKIDDEKVQYKCPKCKYEFQYNIIRKTPTKCHFCGADIAKFKIVKDYGNNYVNY